MQVFNVRIVVNDDDITAADVAASLYEDNELSYFADDSAEERIFVPIYGVVPLISDGFANIAPDMSDAQSDGTPIVIDTLAHGKV